VAVRNENRTCSAAGPIWARGSAAVFWFPDHLHLDGVRASRRRRCTWRSPRETATSSSTRSTLGAAREEILGTTTIHLALVRFDYLGDTFTGSTLRWIWTSWWKPRSARRSRTPERPLAALTAEARVVSGLPRRAAQAERRRRSSRRGAASVPVERHRRGTPTGGAADVRVRVVARRRIPESASSGSARGRHGSAQAP